MKPLYKFEADGVWFSKNGRKAFLRGEKPKFMWPEGTDIIPTGPHHIETFRKVGNQRAFCARKLVMFYRDASKSLIGVGQQTCQENEHSLALSSTNKCKMGSPPINPFPI